MNRIQIEVFEQDYEKLLMRAGYHKDIPFVIKNLIALSDAAKNSITGLKDYLLDPDDVF